MRDVSVCLKSRRVYCENSSWDVVEQQQAIWVCWEGREGRGEQMKLAGVDEAIFESLLGVPGGQARTRWCARGRGSCRGTRWRSAWRACGRPSASSATSTCPPTRCPCAPPACVPGSRLPHASVPPMTSHAPLHSAVWHSLSGARHSAARLSWCAQCTWHVMPCCWRTPVPWHSRLAREGLGWLCLHSCRLPCRSLLNSASECGC